MIIASAVRTMPHTLRNVESADEQVAELTILCGFNDDLTKERTATSNRIQGPLIHIHPALERVIGKHLERPAMLELLAEYPTPAALRRAGKTRMETLLREHAPRAFKRWVPEFFEALDQQSVIVPGTEAAGTVLAHQARSLAHNRAAQADVFTLIEALVEAHSLHELLVSMPGVTVKTAARILTEVSGKEIISPGHLAAYAGLAPVTWRSGTSIRGDHSSKKGNKVLASAVYLSAFASISSRDTTSGIYYDEKRPGEEPHPGRYRTGPARVKRPVCEAARRDHL